jgi:ribosomal protein L3 glutamine methyltransferase
MTRKRLDDLRASRRDYALRQGINPRDVDLLLSDLLGKSLAYLYAHGEMEVDSAPLDARLARRYAGEPLQYIRGHTEFYSRDFLVDSRALIPRPETELLVETAIERAPAHGRVIDIGTGSGCIAIAAAHYCPDVQVDATDVSAAALAVATHNVEQHGLATRVRLFEADLFPPATRGYRVIVSNPPYVPEAEVALLPPEYRHEPVLGLASGPTGFAAAERIVTGALERLTPDGALFLELGAGAERFAAAHPRLPLIALEFERGGDGVLVTTAAEIREFLRVS